jgi:sigma-B regulation protein RsbU (phosphoserine phosphatase)
MKTALDKIEGFILKPLDVIFRLSSKIAAAGRGFLSAAPEINGIRADLEKKVEERTSELNESLKKLEEKEKILKIELNTASQIQKGILPDTSISQNGLQLSAYIQSKDEVSGDFYDIIPLRNNCLGFLIADVSGHGIHAALVATMAKICFIKASQNCLSPKRIFKRVNESIADILKKQEYLTAFFIIVSPAYDILYANASHRPAYVIRKKSDEIDTWDTDGLLIGAIDNSEAGDSYEEKSDRLERGDRIFLYTDGLIEARNNKDEEFGETRLLNLLNETKDFPIEDTKKTIIETWEKFLGDSKASDDVTFLIIELPIVSN